MGGLMIWFAGVQSGRASARQIIAVVFNTTARWL